MSTGLLLSDVQLDALADRVAAKLADLLRPEPAPAGLLSAAQLADRLGCSRAFVYENADRLGAQKLGDGPKARLRFDLDTARAALGRIEAPAVAKPAPRRPSRNRKPTVGSVLAVRGPKVTT